VAIIKKEALSNFYTKRESRKELVTKVSVIALRQLNETRMRIRELFEIFFVPFDSLDCRPQSAYGTFLSI
jgi:hypothetical protein